MDSALSSLAPSSSDFSSSSTCVGEAELLDPPSSHQLIDLVRDRVAVVDVDRADQL